MSYIDSIDKLVDKITGKSKWSLDPEKNPRQYKIDRALKHVTIPTATAGVAYFTYKYFPTVMNYFATQFPVFEPVLASPITHIL